MDDLLQSQIRESCKLALPEGLQELMNDISREVLRSQPENLYQFIADYLEALLNARQALSIACRICGDVSNCSCQPQLEDEISRIGLSPEDVAKAKNIILDHFDKGQVKETNLLIKLATKTSVTEKQLLELQKAIQRAFQRYSTKRKDLQVSFAKCSEDNTERSSESTVSSASTQSRVSDFYKPQFSLDAISALWDQQDKLTSSHPRPTCPLSVSATTLAGSYIDLPQRLPYSVHNSECENILIKSEKSVLSLLKSLLFAEDRHHGLPRIQEHNVDSILSIDSIESRRDVSEEIDDTIRSIFSQDIYEVRSRNSKESQNHEVFTAIQENLQESSSGGSLS